MKKAAIKNFAIWARNKLIADARYRAGLVGIKEEGIQTALPQSGATTEFYDIGTATPYAISGQGLLRQRQNLVEAIRRRAAGSDYPAAYRYIMEEAAYTWFNRLIAVRFMEVNDYLPGRVRVLSSESGKIEPDLVTTPFDAGLSFTAEEEQTILQLKQNSQLDELFRLLFVKQCNSLSTVLPALFEQYDDYTELLLNLSVVDQDGVVWHLTHDIPEEDFNVEKGGQVEIIGWLYQYYNTEPKAQVFARSSGEKIKKEEIPAATQLFTPDWIVQYMVENSLGRLWLEGHPNEELRSRWKYYLDETEQEPEAAAQLEAIRSQHRSLTPEDIKVMDPCMGSGHILVYAFDVLMQIYEKAGWDRREAARSIVEKNLYGLDIDKRAYQLTYFALMMKARQYDRRFLTREVEPQVYCPGGDRELEELGSLRMVEKWDEPETSQTTLTDMADHCRRLLAGKYHVLCTNPPYMAVSNASGNLQKYIRENFPDSKSDLFAVFIERCGQLTGKNGYQAMITQHSWMFLSSFEKLRAKLQASDMVSMAHLGARAFEEIGGEVVQTTSFVLRKTHVKGYQGIYCRLIGPNSQQGKEEMFLAGKNRYAARQDSFSKIPGAPVAYWLSEAMLHAFENGNRFGGETKKGVLTGDNPRFLRLWQEVSVEKIGFHMRSRQDMIASRKKWFPVTSGGEKRKWYGNFDTLVNLENDGAEIKAAVKNYRLREPRYYMQEAITWTEVSSGIFSCRYVPRGILFGNGGPVSFFFHEHLLYHLGLLNSNVAMEMLKCLAPTINYGPEQVDRIPVIKKNEKTVSDLVASNVLLSRTEWDSFETSWDFTRHPLARSMSTVAEAFEAWETECNDRFTRLKANEEELNRIFIDIYGLQGELTPEVEDKDVTVRRADLGRDIRSLLSYAVGCMFGRYSLEVPGLAYAGGEWDVRKYAAFQPDADCILPLTDEAYLENDIISRLCQWLRVVYGPDTLEENLDFIARALGDKGVSSRKIIRNYFLKDFFADHCKIYQKRPIYWLFDSGRQNGFKALIYLHRYTPDTIGKLRVDCLHRLQQMYASEIERMQDMIDNTKNQREAAASSKRKEKLQKQLKECQEYDAKIAHLALARIELELDDGVKVNYEKLQTAADGKKYPVLGKI